jgi:hypothetical protein
VGDDVVLRLEFIKERQMKVSPPVSSKHICVWAALVSPNPHKLLLHLFPADGTIWHLGGGVSSIYWPGGRRQPEGDQGDNTQRLQQFSLATPAHAT